MVLRALLPSDQDSVRRAVDRLSAETLFRRFMHAVRPRDVDLSWIAELGGPMHVAVGAWDPRTGELLGVARAVVVDGSAEVAVTVADRWQGQRIGTRLARALAGELARRGARELTATVAVENRPAVALARRLGARRAEPLQGGVIEVRAPASATEAGAPRS